MINYQEYFKSTDKNTIEKYKKLMNEERNSKIAGFYDLPNEYENILDNLKKCKENFKNKTHFVVIGMGGSSAGAKAITSFLDIENIDYLDNISSKYFDTIYQKINLDKTLFILISKSGNTIESISYFRILIEKLNIKPNELANHIIGICMKNTKMYDFLMTNNIWHFDINENIGGRFSVLSAVGIVPLYLAGVDTKALIDGAIACQNDGQINSHIINLAYTLSTKMLDKNYVLFNYCEELRHFNEWFVQLVAESLGKYKGKTRTGITPIALIGPKDQHSFLQLIIEGPKDKFVHFIRIKPSQNSPKIPDLQVLKTLENQSVGHTLDELLYAQSKSCLDAVTNEGIDVSLIEISEFSAYNIGYLIYYFELIVAACGLMIGINTYDQPGVESAKKLLKKLLTNS